MKLFISDLHISSPFFNKDEELISLFNDPSFEEIYVLGDIIDTWEEHPIFTINRHRKLLDVMNNKVTTIIIGNHDPVIEEMRVIFNKVPVLFKHKIDLFGKEALLTHGHNLSGDMNKWAKNVFFIQYFLARFGVDLKSIILKLLTTFTKKVKGLSDSDILLASEQYIIDTYSKECDIIIAGHTHLPKIVETPEALYANCGSIYHINTYMVADDNTLTIRRL